jgi:2-hydroxy-6-oxonona-2,4-dienedioate hydrolase
MSPSTNRLSPSPWARRRPPATFAAVPYLELPTGEIYYDSFGAGTPIVLTAGGLAAHTTMRPLMEKLVSRGYQVVLWDRAGQGLAQVAFEGDSEIELHAGQLRRLIEALGLGPAYVAGASEGSRICFRTALRYSELVRGVFLWQVSAGAVAGPLREVFHEQYARVAEQEGMDAVARTPHYTERVKLNPSSSERIRSFDRDAFVALRRRWQEELREDDPILGHTAEEASRLAVPLGIVGGVDSAHPRAQSEQLAALVEGARFFEPPYTHEDWLAVDLGPGLYLYAGLPGLDRVLDDFVSSVEAAPGGVAAAPTTPR